MHRVGWKAGRGDEVPSLGVEPLDVLGDAAELKAQERRPELGAEQLRVVALRAAARRAEGAVRPEALNGDDHAHAQADGAGPRLHEVDPEVRVQGDIVGERDAGRGWGSVSVLQEAAEARGWGTHKAWLCECWRGECVWMRGG